MSQHSTDGFTQEEIWRWLASQSSSGLKGRPYLLNRRDKRVGSGCSCLFLLLTRHVSLHSVINDFFFGGHPEVSLPTTPKPRYCGEEHGRKFLQDWWWRLLSLSSSSVEGFATHPRIWLFSAGLIVFVHFIQGRVCRNAHEIPTCWLACWMFCDDGCRQWPDHVNGDHSRRESDAACGAWNCRSAVLISRMVDWASQRNNELVQSVAPSVRNWWNLLCPWKCKLSRSNTCPTESKQTSLRFSGKCPACSPARTHSVLYTVSWSLFFNVLQAREPRNRHSDFIPGPCDKHSFMGLFWQCPRF